MTLPDIVNGIFESLGAIFVFFSIRKLWRNKSAAGVSWFTIGYFASWGLWNLYYYPHLGQWISFYGGIGVAIANIIYTGMILWYSRKGKS